MSNYLKILYLPMMLCGHTYRVQKYGHHDEPHKMSTFNNCIEIISYLYPTFFLRIWAIHNIIVERMYKIITSILNHVNIFVLGMPCCKRARHLQGLFSCFCCNCINWGSGFTMNKTEKKNDETV